MVDNNVYNFLPGGFFLPGKGLQITKSSKVVALALLLPVADSGNCS